MNTRAEIMKRLAIRVAVVCVFLGLAAAAFAVLPSEVLFVGNIQTFTGLCCSRWGETVLVTEPKAVVPVVVTWSTDYRMTDSRFFHVGVSVNGHPCLVNDLSFFAPADGSFVSRTLQWVTFPSDGLVQGTNNITLCGGGGDASDTITLGGNTLAVRIAK